MSAPCRGLFRLKRVGLALATGLALVAMNPAGFAAETDLETPTLALSWGQDDAAPQTWRILADESRWRSILSRDRHGDPLSRHLALDGPGFDHMAWHIESRDPHTVTATGRAPDNPLAVRQTFTSAEVDYRLELVVEVENRSGRVIEADGLSLTLGPGLGEIPVEGLGMATRLYSFVEAIGSADGKVKRPAPDETEVPRPLESLDHPDWLGLYSRYFALLVAPADPADIAAVRLNHFNDRGSETLPARYLPQLIMTLDADTLAAGESRRWTFTVFSGPRSRQATGAGETAFDGVLFPGLWEWMRYLCFGLLWLLEALFALIPSWGLAIIVLALLVRLAMYPLARRALAGQHAFAEVQRKIQPEIREIKKNYSGGEQSERILKLYERHNVSPLAGLKPLLIVLVQIPVFVALFHVLGQAYELREASFLWMDTLAEPDRLFGFGTELPFFGASFNLLPVLLAVTTLLTLKLSPAPAADAAAQRRQNIFLGLMAVGFFLVFYPFPSGMVLYWTTANVLHIVQSRITPSP